MVLPRWIRRLLCAYFLWILPIAREHNRYVIAGISVETLVRWKILWEVR